VCIYDIYTNINISFSYFRPRGEGIRKVACDDHDFAGRLVDGVIEPVPRSMAAKFEVEVGKPGKTLYVIRHGGFPEFL
jgi:hypothetical protein